MNEQKIARIASVNVFRALTMFLMIFVNDLWTLQNIPSWLEHVSATEDGLGLADVVFPAFLFIVGLSTPLAINQRLAKGDSRAAILTHTLWRALALIIMGVFHVNLESYNVMSVLPKPLWEILITLGFFLIWLDYPKDFDKKRKYFLRGIGIVLLVLMAAAYRGGTPDHPEWMTTQWWGILGLIGWSYLMGSLIYLIFKKQIIVHFLFFLFFLFFSAAEKLHGLEFLKFIRPYVWIISDGALPAIVMAGIVTSGLYVKAREKSEFNGFFILTSLGALVLIVFCFITRPWWGINKIMATPSWVALCTAVSILTFIFLIVLVDRNQKEKWFALIAPAGTSTLTAYLLPYLHYSIISWLSLSLPMVLRTGSIGILKSLVYALLIIILTGFLEKRKIKVRL